MQLSELCTQIELPQEVIKRVLKEEKRIKNSKPENLFRELRNPASARKAYDKLENYLGSDPDHMKMLTCQLLCACEDHAEYAKRGIDEQIFTDTMKCYTRFLKECKDRTGKTEFDRGWWTYRQISMVLFRIGELEYELTQLKGQKAVSVHIPSDASFTPEQVDESLKRSEEFIATFYPDYEATQYFCESWLLSPRLSDMVKETSNIRKFQKLFTIQEDMPEDKEYMEWLFGKTLDTPLEELPEKTSLQRKAKELLRNGGNLGAGVGILTKTFTLKN